MAITNFQRLYRRTSFIAVATTANQVAMSVDLSAYASNDCGYHFMVKLTPVHGSGGVLASTYSSVRGYKLSSNTFQADASGIIGSTHLSSGGSGVVGFQFSGNTFQITLDGGGTTGPMLLEVEGIIAAQT
jgi:hypothetical protein